MKLKITYHGDCEPRFTKRLKIGGMSDYSATSKVEVLIRRVSKKLNLDTDNLPCNIEVFPDKKTVAAEYFRIYSKKFNKPGFYALLKNKIFLSARNVNTKIVRHEVAHAILSQYFSEWMPRDPQEVLARWCEKQ